MENRILREIRYYELRPSGYNGKFDGSLGNVFKNSTDTKYIGQRIARKLNELGFISGQFDHIYIYFSTGLKDNEIAENDIHLDKRIKIINYGINPFTFNNSDEQEKNRTIKAITFNVLQWCFKNDELKNKQIWDVINQINEHDRQLKIHFVAKETTSYYIDLSYQIRPINDKSNLIIHYTDKKDNISLAGELEIFDYEDLYSLVDKISILDNVITFQPKKSVNTELILRKYKNMPLRIEINKMIKI